jgi:hypothetical protein
MYEMWHLWEMAPMDHGIDRSPLDVLSSAMGVKRFCAH